MARGKLFEYAVIYHPREKKDAAGNPLEQKKSITSMTAAMVRQ